MSRLSIMTWNVLYEEKADNILLLIKKVNPDILCCQEITTNSWINPNRDVPAEIGRMLGGYHVYQKALSDLDGKPASMGNAIISKFPIINHRHVFVQKGGSDITQNLQNRVYLEAELRIGSKSLTVGTTHLSYVDAFIETEARNKEADDLVHAIQQNKVHFIITGDFNSAPSSKTIRKMEKLYTSAGPVYSRKTFTTKPFTHGDFSVNDLEWRLDYIFASKDIEVNNSKIINTHFSDHLPILAKIQI